MAGTTAQRVRIGLTGLAFAFLLVLLGSIISRSGDDRTAADEAQTVDANEAEPAEPLAELGVAPGAPTRNEAQANNFVGPRP